jgi:hypothetical protein
MTFSSRSIIKTLRTILISVGTPALHPLLGLEEKGRRRRHRRTKAAGNKIDTIWDEVCKELMVLGSVHNVDDLLRAFNQIVIYLEMSP